MISDFYECKTLDTSQWIRSLVSESDVISELVPAAKATTEIWAFWLVGTYRYPSAFIKLLQQRLSGIGTVGMQCDKILEKVKPGLANTLLSSSERFLVILPTKRRKSLTSKSRELSVENLNLLSQNFFWKSADEAFGGESQVQQVMYTFFW